MDDGYWAVCGRPSVDKGFFEDVPIDERSIPEQAWDGLKPVLDAAACVVGLATATEVVGIGFAAYGCSQSIP